MSAVDLRENPNANSPFRNKSPSTNRLTPKNNPDYLRFSIAAWRSEITDLRS
jgi:hypothetical protein